MISAYKTQFFNLIKQNKSVNLCNTAPSNISKFKICHINICVYVLKDALLYIQRFHKYAVHAIQQIQIHFDMIKAYPNIICNLYFINVSKYIIK